MWGLRLAHLRFSSAWWLALCKQSTQKRKHIYVWSVEQAWISKYGRCTKDNGSKPTIADMKTDVLKITLSTYACVVLLHRSLGFRTLLCHSYLVVSWSFWIRPHCMTSVHGIVETWQSSVSLAPILHNTRLSLPNLQPYNHRENHAPPSLSDCELRFGYYFDVSFHGLYKLERCISSSEQIEEGEHNFPWWMRHFPDRQTGAFSLWQRAKKCFQ